MIHTKINIQVVCDCRYSRMCWGANNYTGLTKSEALKNARVAGWKIGQRVKCKACGDALK